MDQLPIPGEQSAQASYQYGHRRAVLMIPVCPAPGPITRQDLGAPHRFS
jgi:hypothetical protein